jgi:hypothetical integral membrane protein (TIGR02206 family)
VWPVSQQILRKGWVKPVAWGLAVIIVIELVVKTIGHSAYGMPWNRLLPLQICDVNAILCALMLIMRSYGVYQVAYFWAMAGSTAAMLTPDLQFDFPHPIFAFFFLGHGFSIMGVLYATFAFGFQPRIRSVGIALLATVLYASVMLAMNYLIGSNYLYLRAKPTASSVLDYMGPWPWYVVGLFLLSVAACFIVYAPFPITRKLRANRKQ